MDMINAKQARELLTRLEEHERQEEKRRTDRDTLIRRRHTREFIERVPNYIQENIAAGNDEFFIPYDNPIYGTEIVSYMVSHGYSAWLTQAKLQPYDEAEKEPAVAVKVPR